MIEWDADAKNLIALGVCAGLVGCGLSFASTIFRPGLFIYVVAPIAAIVFLMAMAVLVLVITPRATRIAIWVAATCLAIGSGPSLYLAI